MSQRLAQVFESCRKEERPAFVAYMTAGYPTVEDVIPLLKAMEAGGADVIELGVPFTDPIADGVTLQKTSEVALKNGVSYTSVLGMVKSAREAGIKAPLILMGYYNPLLAYGEEKAIKDAATAGADGFILVDAPIEEAIVFSKRCKQNSMSYVPLVTVTTTDDRLKYLGELENTFVYCVSVTGITGERTALPEELGDFVARVRSHTKQPLAVGFGVSTRQHVEQVGRIADGVVVGSAICKAIDAKGAAGVTEFIKLLTTGKVVRDAVKPAPPPAAAANGHVNGDVDLLPARFGDFGGQYVPETLMAALRELEEAFVAAKKDASFWKELEALHRDYVGRPTPLYFAKRLTDEIGGAKIWLKREDLAHTGAHKINNTVGQALLAKRLGKKRIVAETGAGQHGVATATVCALMDLECIVYMGAEDIRRQSLNVFRMKVLGATVIPVTSGSATLKDAVNEAMRDWVTNVRDTFYLIGSAIGPHPFPTIVRDFQSVIGTEARQQMLDQAGTLPDVAVACVGGGSNSIGLFFPFINDPTVQLVGAEAAGDGVSTGKHSAVLVAGVPGVLHGMRTYLLQDSDGQILETHSISAGLDYPGVGPEHCHLKSTGRATYVGVDDKQALEGFQLLSRTEGIIPALEPSHAIYAAVQIAKGLPKEKNVLINMCGRGDKDMLTVAAALGVKL